MSDRGLPIVDGAPACPFVAFEDDRDGRATAPDHRHRCFAEPRPAPRALAHQEAFCLSSAFPVCPTFQDWARREAAAARPAHGRPADADEEPPRSQPMPPLDREEYRPPGTELSDVTPRRSSQRDWTAPPPWAGSNAAGAAGMVGAAGGAAATGGAAAAAAAGATAGAGEATGAGATASSGAAGAIPGWSPAPPEADAPPPESRGLAGSAADRLASPDPSDPLAPTPTRSPYDTAGRSVASGDPTRGEPAEDDDEPDWGQPEAAAIGSERTYAPAPQRAPVRDDRAVPDANPRDQVSKRQPQDPSDLFGPAWERPRRYEAYPSLRTRVGLPNGMAGIGRIGLGALGLAVAALALFFIGPLLLGIGSDSNTGGGSGGSRTAAPSAIVEETASPDPTAVPAPTPQVYLVKKGDTMSKIASKFNVTVEDLLAANTQIKNPNKISIGDPITIPVPGDAGGGDSASP